MQPFRISDADFASFGALTICSVGAPTPPGFWFLKTDHVANSTGADQTFIKPGDQLVFYRTPSDFTADEELAIDAPARTTPGSPIAVQVRSYAGDGAASPGAGATVSGGDTPVSVDAAGNATGHLQLRRGFTPWWRARTTTTSQASPDRLRGSRPGSLSAGPRTADRGESRATT